MHLTVSSQGSALIWRLHRPDRLNALGTSLGQDLLQALRKLQNAFATWNRQDGTQPVSPRVLIITATPIATDRAQPIWIAGGDLKELHQLREAKEGRSYAWLWAEICNGIQDLPIPVLAAIDGQAIGGGAELALAADLRIATSRSALHFKQLEVGLATGYGTCQRLIALVGQARATDLLLRCRCIEAHEAEHFGLINQIIDDPEQLLTSCLTIAEKMATLSAQSLRIQKFMLQQAARDRRDHLVQGELDAFEELWMQPFHRKFLESFENRLAHSRGS